MIIDAIHTGKALEGGRKAIISLNAETPQQPGALADFRAYLTAQGLTAFPGFDGGHLLRVRGLQSDDQLRQLIDGYAKDRPDFIAKDLPYIPLDRADRQPFVFGRFVRKNATGLVGVTSLISGSAFLAKESLHFRHTLPQSLERSKSMIGITASSLFVAASAVLTWLGFAAAHKPSVAELIGDMDPAIRNGLQSEDLTDRRSSLRRGYDYMRNNPWQLATFLNGLGTTIKFTSLTIPEWKEVRDKKTGVVSKLYQRDKMELAGSGSSFLGLGFLATATPQDPPSLLGIPSFEKSRFNYDPVQRRYAHGFFSPFDPANDQGAKGHMNMKIAGYLGMASNAVFGAKGALDVYKGYRAHDAIGRKAFNSWPLLLVLPFNIAADYLTTISKPRFVYSLDELATETAAYIAKKLDTKTTDTETITHQIFVLSELLARHPRVTRTSHQLREAIAGRLRLDYGYHLPSEGDGMKEYMHLHEISPFADKTRQEPANDTVAAPEKDAHFAEKLVQEREHGTDAARAIVR